MALIDLRNINLTFRIRKHGQFGLKELLIALLRKSKLNPTVEIHALKDLTLQIHEGDRVGVIGHNGAGKSTLLRLIAGVYPPTSGTRHVTGEVTSLMDIGLGIEPTASGWDNIAYRCFLQGDTPKDVEAKRPGIAEFSELNEYLQIPIRFYSSGMYVRLAFAIATAVHPDILLLDEVLGAGDIGFQDKARDRMMDLVDKAKALVFVSHDLVSIKKLCNRVLWMDQGKLIDDGPAETVIDRYLNR
ncbi:MAG: ABC transporter ATP-binding protein, partial [Gemmataceae bacterium]